MADSKIKVEVAYALPQKQQIFSFEVPLGTTVAEAAQLSGVVKVFPNVDLNNAKFGIFGKAVKADQLIQAGERVEIYRPLIADPKEARKKRAVKIKERKATE